MPTSFTYLAAFQSEIVDFPQNALHFLSRCLRIIAHGLVNQVCFIEFVDKISISYAMMLFSPLLGIIPCNLL